MTKQEKILYCLQNNKYKVDKCGEIYRYRKNKSCYLPITKNYINGYGQIILFGGRGSGLIVSTYLHIAIYLYFNGLYPENLNIDHINGNKKDNSFNNLQAISPKENSRKAIKPKVKTLTINKEEGILKIYDLYKKGLTQYAASKQTGINRLTIRYIFKKFDKKEAFKYCNIDFYTH